MDDARGRGRAQQEENPFAGMTSSSDSRPSPPVAQEMRSPGVTLQRSAMIQEADVNAEDWIRGCNRRLMLAESVKFQCNFNLGAERRPP